MRKANLSEEMQEERKREGGGQNGGGRLVITEPKGGDRLRTEKEAQVH